MAFPSEAALTEPLTVFRLHPPGIAPLDPTGAAIAGGRWNSPGRLVVYAAESYETAVAELRQRANGAKVPPKLVAEIVIPQGTVVATLGREDVPRWGEPSCLISRVVGDAWVAAGRTVALLVPCKAGGDAARQVVFNLAHADAGRLVVGDPGKARWVSGM